MRILGQVFAVARSDISDLEATVQLKALAENAHNEAREALEWLDESCRRSRSNYLTDRAQRVLRAAMKGAVPEPIDPNNRLLFERERLLGLSPQEEAFALLESSAAGLKNIRDAASLLASDPALHGVSVKDGRVSIPHGLVPNACEDVKQAADRDLIFASAVARSLIYNFPAAVITNTSDLPLWGSDTPIRNGYVTGGFVES